MIDVRTMNSWFPKIENLEYFPFEMLLKVFTTVDDLGLLSLAENSHRFESIAKIVLNKRYTNEYFSASAITPVYDNETYEDFFQLFGNEIKAIEIEERYFSEGNHWIVKLLNRTNNLEKLKLFIGAIRTTNSNENLNLLQQHATSSITHLTLRNQVCHTDNGFVLSKFNNLKQLELIDNPCISFAMLKEVIHNNPELERLYIGDKTLCGYGYDIVRFYPFDKLMVLIGAHSKQLKEFAYVPICYGSFRLPVLHPVLEQPDHIVDAFVDSLVHLETLALSFENFDNYTNVVKLLYRLGKKCKNIKHLELLIEFYDQNDVFMAIESFQRVEKLLLTINKDANFEYGLIESLVENLPMLRHLYIGSSFEHWSNEIFDWSLRIISKCPSLEKVTICAELLRLNVEIFSTARFFEAFSDCTQTRNVKIEVKNEFELIGTITKNEVIWRNKRVHWVGYDPSRNLSNIHLMDLTNRSTANSNAEQQRNTTDPFDLILRFLDLNSLQSLSRTNRKCSQLVDEYVKQHSQNGGTFTITNEFFTDENDEYKLLTKFVEHVTDLRVNIHRFEDMFAFRNMIKQFSNVKKLYVYTAGYTDPCLMGPQVRHYIFHAERVKKSSPSSSFNYVKLHDISYVCPDLQTFEIKQKITARVNIQKYPLEFRNLKTFIFTYDERGANLEELQSIFNGLKTRLIFRNDTSEIDCINKYKYEWN